VRIIVGISGATGAVFGIRILEALRKYNVETHLIISRWARYTIPLETNYTVKEVEDIASVVYNPSDQAAAISSGSFQVDGMIIAPCSMKTLASIRMGMSETLLGRAADVSLKERRKLIILPRETPLSTIHLENMLTLSKMGATIIPPMPAFYNNPNTIDDIINHIVARTLDQLGIENTLTKRWQKEQL